jgi:hypothetical protein
LGWPGYRHKKYESELGFSTRLAGSGIRRIAIYPIGVRRPKGLPSALGRTALTPSFLFFRASAYRIMAGDGCAAWHKKPIPHTPSPQHRVTNWAVYSLKSFIKS